MNLNNVLKKLDGTYNIDFNGMPFNVTKDYPCGSTTWDIVDNYVKNGGEHTIETLPPEPTIEELKAQKTIIINRSCEQEIIAGFWYIVKGQRLHFSYDTFDQQNFADTSNASIVMTMSGTSLPAQNWNGYIDIEHKNMVVLSLNFNEFQDLYIQGALISHKARLMEKAKTLKEQVASAMTKEQIEAIQWNA